MQATPLPAEAHIFCECSNPACGFTEIKVPTEQYLADSHSKPACCYQRPECAKWYEKAGFTIKLKTETYWVVVINDALPEPTFEP